MKDDKEKKLDFMTVEELAEILKVSPRTIQRIINRGELRAVRIGRQWRFRKDWVDKWLEKKCSDAEGADSA